MEAIASTLGSFLDGTEQDCWIVDEAVDFCGREEEFFRFFERRHADFLATRLRIRSADPGWPFWNEMQGPRGISPATIGEPLAAALPLVRLSRKAAASILGALSAGWTGHPEVLLPTLAKSAGMLVEDIGGRGLFTPPDRVGRWYDDRTWKTAEPVEFVPGMIHFPALPRILHPGRLASPVPSAKPRILYVSPAGASAAPLLENTLRRFLAAGADCLLLQYDEADLPLPAGVRVIRDRGAKWQLASRHLKPGLLDSYDYLFFWDDDIDAGNFDPLHFVRIMQANKLDMAQPAIKSPHAVSHQITRRKPLPPPWRSPDGLHAYPVAGRLTNFVEIMVPVFTREAWRELYGWIDASSASGWGHDLVPLGRRGVVDLLPVVHTRPVRSSCDASRAELGEFLSSRGLYDHPQYILGLLFDTG